VRNYLLFGMASLFLVVVCLADRGLGWWCLMPALIGAIALLAEWGLGPPLVLMSLTGLLLSVPRPRNLYAYLARDQMPTLLDLVLGAAVLGYAMTHYRYLALVRHVFPPDPHRPSGGRADPGRRRSADLVSPREMVLVALSLPLWMGLAVVAWGWAVEDLPPLDMSRELFRTLRLIWAVLAVVGATVVVSGYLRQAAATTTEAQLYLQDVVWRATRREQSHLNRWLVWARLRAQRSTEAGYRFGATRRGARITLSRKRSD
jgi:hypothetical protein